MLLLLPHPPPIIELTAATAGDAPRLAKPAPPPPPELAVDMDSVDPSGAVVTTLPPPPEEKAAPRPGRTAPTAWPGVGDRPPTTVMEAGGRGAVGRMKPPPPPKAPARGAGSGAATVVVAAARLAVAGARKPPPTAVGVVESAATPTGERGTEPVMMSGVEVAPARAASAATVRPVGRKRGRLKRE